MCGGDRAFLPHVLCSTDRLLGTLHGVGPGIHSTLTEMLRDQNESTTDIRQASSNLCAACITPNLHFEWYMEDAKRKHKVCHGSEKNYVTNKQRISLERLVQKPQKVQLQ